MELQEAAARGVCIGVRGQGGSGSRDEKERRGGKKAMGRAHALRIFRPAVFATEKTGLSFGEFLFSFPGTMHPLDPLLNNNRKWAEAINARDPEFFPMLSRQQAPQYLWIGCSDSRVPANEICGLLPGEIFVHRNVANIVVHSDLNCLSVMQYAVDVLKVKHVIVVGHYGCGGVRAALERQKFGLIDNWLRHVQDVAAKYTDHLACLPDDSARHDRLCELNVINQVLNAASTTIIQNAWERGQELAVHGLVYGLKDGRMRQLGISISSVAELATAMKTRWEEKTPSLPKQT
jgi:carbonic anhydrase